MRTGNSFKDGEKKQWAWPLEAGGRKETDSPLETPERNDVGPMRPVAHF